MDEDENQNIDLEKLKNLIEEIEIKKHCRSLSDEYLLDHNCSTRKDTGIGEYAYGIVMVPEEWVLPYLKFVLKLNDTCLSYESDLTKTEVALNKANKMIDEILKYFSPNFDCPLDRLDSNNNLEAECWKKYFENKVGEEYGKYKR